MAIKKSELYSTLWQSCDELRGGMDASQYKDYVLVLLFIKYISDKYAGVPYAPITVPKGASFADMVALKGKTTIGDDINKKIIGKIATANQLTGTIDVADFNDSDKLGSGKDMVDRLTKLVGIFENPALDFSKNRAEGDDILGDAYEYLMRHFATESGKSKGQFYTPAEVSRILAKVIGVNSNTRRSTTVYDPTCGSGSLLLKVADESESGMTIYGQENDTATAALARMNMVLHDYASAVQEIRKENTLANPQFTDAKGRLKTFDFVVANPPFSYKSWSNGVTLPDDKYGRFEGFGIPPNKNGDYAFLLHIIHSMKSKAKGACILPHGVLFRGNAEADIRTNIIRRGYIKGIIGLPANLFYGTGIPACIIVLDKENAENRKGIFMIDASKGFVKDGNKNRLRDQDIHKIVDVFNKQLEIEKYSRMVSIDELEKKHEFNLNIPRYIDTQEPEDIQDIEAHLLGSIPKTDIDALDEYWDIYPSLRRKLFVKIADRKKYSDLKVTQDKIKQVIFDHPEFTEYTRTVTDVFDKWKKKNRPKLKAIAIDDKPKSLIHEISEGLLRSFGNISLIDKYDVYQHLMTYWAETMQDDVYALVVDGWAAGNEIEYEDKKQTRWDGRLIPKQLVINRFFFEEQDAINILESESESISGQLTEMQEEHGSEKSPLYEVTNKAGATTALNEYIDLAWQEYFPETYKAYEKAKSLLKKLDANLIKLKENTCIQKLKNKKGNITKTAVTARLKHKAIDDEKAFLKRFIEVTANISAKKKNNKELLEDALRKIDKKTVKSPIAEFLAEIAIIKEYQYLTEKLAAVKKTIKAAIAELDEKLLEKYPQLTEKEIKSLVVDDKWLAVMDNAIWTEMDRVSQRLTGRIKELAVRYETPLPQLTTDSRRFTKKVDGHLRMTMEHLLTGNKRLPGFDGQWETKTLGDISIKFLNGGTPSTSIKEYWNGSIPWISGADIIGQRIPDVRRFITEDAINNSSTNIVEKGNLLIVTRTGVGKLAIAPYDIAISQDITGVYIEDEIDVGYLFNYLNFNIPLLKSFNQGTSISGITREYLESIQISVPSTKDEQIAIAEIFSDINYEIDNLEQRLDKYEMIKQGMMQELLTGKTRLI